MKEKPGVGEMEVKTVEGTVLDLSAETARLMETGHLWSHCRGRRTPPRQLFDLGSDRGLWAILLVVFIQVERMYKRRGSSIYRFGVL